MFQQDHKALFNKIMKQIKKNTHKNAGALNPNFPKNTSKASLPKKKSNFV
jgi:hypothetical protein